MILIDALFINKGGGAVLLQYLIETILAHPRKDDFFFLLDPRFDKPAISDKNFTVISNKLSDRIRFYKHHKSDFTKVFCFANTPPPVKLNVPVYTYFHNQKLLEAPGKRFAPGYFKIYLKYLFVKRYNRNTDYYIVQTPHMVKELTALGLKDRGHCLQIPFYDNRKYTTAAKKPFDDRPKDVFVFISNPSPQKNYPTLLDAWEYLFEKGHTPKLFVTIDDTAPALLERVAVMKAKGIQVENVGGYIDPAGLYLNYRYLVFPSVVESFGLPLIEATDSGMKVLASDLPYVHDVIRPSFTFNPLDKTSIAEAVIKALGADLPFPALVTTNDIDKLLQVILGN